MSHFFAYLARLKLILRWGLMRNTCRENVQEHSLQVAMVAHGLALIRNRYFGGNVDPERALALAVFHEVGEVFTGDLATPIKYFNPKIKEAYDAIDVFAKDRLLKMLPPELAQDYRRLFFPDEADAGVWRLVKAADKICAYLKCLEEIKAGNQEFAKAERAVRAEIDRFGLPEVAFFMEHFVPSFSLALDELN